jgi:CheY-like chemotaxis protein
MRSLLKFAKANPARKRAPQRVSKMSVNPPATILCVDDNETALNVRKMILEMAGYSVLTASDGDLAMQLFTSSTVDMVISDHLLQGKTGTELAAEMKRLNPTIPIVIVSGVVQEPEGMENADLFMVKGEAPAAWLKKISDLLQKSRCQAPQYKARSAGQS